MLMAGCNTEPEAIPATSSSRATQLAPTSQTPPAVIHGDRYLMINTEPAAEQRDPLNQIIDVSIPADVKPTVSEAIRYLLRDSGYSLCFASQQRQLLYQQPLPLAQTHLGPIPLHEALQVLAGPVWRLTVDRLYRIVCFRLQPYPLKTGASYAG
ncbi:pilus assembly protein PilL [Winslowiella toletana]